MSDPGSSQNSSNEIESDEREKGKPLRDSSNEEEKTQAETQINLELESKPDNVVEYVMVVGFHHHIGAQVGSQDF